MQPPVAGLRVEKLRLDLHTGSLPGREKNVAVIDVHTHLHPPRLFAAIRRWFADRSTWDLSAQPSEPRDVARALERAGVERFVFFSYAHKPGMAGELNEWLCATARELGGAGLPLGTVHLDDSDPLGDLERALDGGCAGIKIHEDVQRLAVDDARFDPLFQTIAARNGVVIAHVGPMPWRLLPGEGPKRIAAALERHPALQFVVAHMGVPDTGAYCELFERFPNLYLDTTMAFAPASPVERRIDPDLVRANASRILYGTDFPNTPYPYEEEARGIRALGLDRAALTAILGENARALFAPFW
ncbi:MAG: amidohydrolase [Candidatus Eremiobacteraeota bacterium]|nr:amidohydrolase [Candidatus Eremiobacteraeota bacterium]